MGFVLSRCCMYLRNFFRGDRGGFAFGVRGGTPCVGGQHTKGVGVGGCAIHTPGATVYTILLTSTRNGERRDRAAYAGYTVSGLVLVFFYGGW